MDIRVEGLVFAETGGVCHDTIGVVEVVFKASNLEIGFVSLGVHLDMMILEQTYGTWWQAGEVLSPEEGGENGKEGGVEEHDG